MAPMDVVGKWKIGMGPRFSAIWNFAPDGLVHNVSFGGAGKWKTAPEGIDVLFHGGRTLHLRREAECLVLTKDEGGQVRAILSRLPETAPEMKDLTILFIHHNKEPVTRRHYDLLQKYNSEATIVPVAYPGQSQVLDQTWRFGEFFPDKDWGLDPALAWSSVDLLAMNYVLSPQAKRTRKICFFEYDILCNIPLTEYFHDVWDFGLVARDLMFPGRSAWNWFTSIPLDFAQYALGVRPLVALLIDYEAVFRMAVFCKQHPETWGMFTEARVGTLFNLLMREEMTVIPHPFRTNIDSEPIRFDISRPSLFHPVKQVVRF